MSELQHLAEIELGIILIRPHDQVPALIRHAHRFRATDKDGLFSLAKDLARLTADSIDASALQKLVAPPKGTKWGSLKSLENVLAKKIGADRARAILGPLFGIYELRHADAHLSSNELSHPLNLVRVDEDAPYVVQGYQLLHACVSSIYGICKEIKNWNTTAT